MRQCFIKEQSERDKTVCVSSQTTKKGESSQNETQRLKSYFRIQQCIAETHCRSKAALGLRRSRAAFAAFPSGQTHPALAKLHYRADSARSENRDVRMFARWDRDAIAKRHRSARIRRDAVSRDDDAGEKDEGEPKEEYVCSHSPTCVPVSYKQRIRRVDQSFRL